MTRLTSVAVLLATLALSSALPLPAAAQAPPRRLQLSFESDGTVTLHAASVSVREVLMEWARQCGCAIVNAPNVPGTIDMPVEFNRARQDVVLASLLRRAAGFVLTPRRAGMTGPSQFETVYVLPTSNASASAAAYVPPQPAFTPVAPPTAGSPADEIPPVTPIPSLPPQAGSAAGQPQTPAPPAAPQQPARIGVPTRFVPIVPIGGSTPAAPTPGAGAPGSPGTPPAPAPSPGASTVPVVPAR
jgi:hypothetical protein